LNTGNQFNIEGQLKDKFDFIDRYHFLVLTIQESIIYRILILVTNENLHKYQTLVKRPGDIPYNGDEIPWKNILNSASNIILLILLIIATETISWRLWPLK
jgi:hypothetical protein